MTDADIDELERDANVNPDIGTCAIVERDEVNRLIAAFTKTMQQDPSVKETLHVHCDACGKSMLAKSERKAKR